MLGTDPFLWIGIADPYNFPIPILHSLSDPRLRTRSRSDHRSCPCYCNCSFHLPPLTALLRHLSHHRIHTNRSNSGSIIIIIYFKLLARYLVNIQK